MRRQHQRWCIGCPIAVAGDVAVQLREFSGTLGDGRRSEAGILGKRLRPSVEEVTGRNHGVAGRTVAVVFSVSSPSGGGGRRGREGPG